MLTADTAITFPQKPEKNRLLVSGTGVMNVVTAVPTAAGDLKHDDVYDRYGQQHYGVRHCGGRYNGGR